MSLFEDASTVCFKKGDWPGYGYGALDVCKDLLKQIIMLA